MLGCLATESPAARSRFSGRLRQLGELEFNSGEYRKAADHLNAHERRIPTMRSGGPLRRAGTGEAGRFARRAEGARSCSYSIAGKTRRTPFARPHRLEVRRSGGRARSVRSGLLLDPANRDALISLAKEHLEDKRFADVVELLEPHVKDASVTVDELKLLIQAYVGLGRTADAEKVRAQAETLQHRRAP